MTASRLAPSTSPAIFIMGPTASGKSALALALAKRFAVEIISVDSAQVYRGMDIGTAKPDATTQAAVPHHLLDMIDPTEVYSAARFRNDALELMRDITLRKRVPLLVGGTMLYFRALSAGLSDLPEADQNTRRQLEMEAARDGWPALHAQLQRIDPETAGRLEPADSQRIQRALEVYRLTGLPISALRGKRGGAALPFRTLKIALLPSDRAVLHRRIAARFETMLRAGLVDEVRGLRERYLLNANSPSMRCVGYRQAWEYLDGAANERELTLRGLAATRQLAKRQLTWLRAMDDVEEFDCLRQDIVELIMERVGNFLNAREARTESPGSKPPAR